MIFDELIIEIRVLHFSKFVHAHALQPTKQKVQHWVPSVMSSNEKPDQCMIPRSDAITGTSDLVLPGCLCMPGSTKSRCVKQSSEIMMESAVLLSVPKRPSIKMSNISCGIMKNMKQSNIVIHTLAIRKA